MHGYVCVCMHRCALSLMGHLLSTQYVPDPEVSPGDSPVNRRVLVLTMALSLIGR